MITPDPQRGGLIVNLNSSRYQKILLSQGGPAFTDIQSQQALRIPEAERLFPTIDPVDGQANVLRYALYLPNDGEVLSRSYQLGRSLPAAEVARVEEALRALQNRATNEQINARAHELFTKIRFPDPDKEPELYRVYKHGGEKRLAILYGISHRRQDQHLTAEQLLHRLRTKSRSAFGIDPALLTLIAALIAFAIILGGAWWYMSSTGDTKPDPIAKNCAGTGNCKPVPAPPGENEKKQQEKKEAQKKEAEIKEFGIKPPQEILDPNEKDKLNEKDKKEEEKKKQEDEKKKQEQTKKQEVQNLIPWAFLGQSWSSMSAANAWLAALVNKDAKQKTVVFQPPTFPVQLPERVDDRQWKLWYDQWAADMKQQLDDRGATAQTDNGSNPGTATTPAKPLITEADQFRVTHQQVGKNFTFNLVPPSGIKTSDLRNLVWKSKRANKTEKVETDAAGKAMLKLDFVAEDFPLVIEVSGEDGTQKFLIPYTVKTIQ